MIERWLLINPRHFTYSTLPNIIKAVQRIYGLHNDEAKGTDRSIWNCFCPRRQAGYEFAHNVETKGLGSRDSGTDQLSTLYYKTSLINALHTTVNHMHHFSSFYKSIFNMKYFKQSLKEKGNPTLLNSHLILVNRYFTF